MNYLDRALSDLKLSKMILQADWDDEAMYDNAAFHVQQCMEKCLKHILHDLAGIDDTTREFKTHNITFLINAVHEKTDFKVPTDIQRLAFMVTYWEANSRYPSAYVANRDEIALAVDKCDALIELVAEYKENQ